MDKDLIKMFVSEDILSHFEFEGYEYIDGVYKIYLIEKDDLERVPKEILKTGKAVRDGYMNSLELQTYPVNTKEVFLHLKRRRWKVKGTNKGYHNIYKFHREGMKATKSFGAFLKEIGRG